MVPDISYEPCLIADPVSLLAESVNSLVWDDRMRARRNSSCGTAYNYSGIRYPDTSMPPFVAALATRIAAVVAHPITNCLANLYTSGESSTGFHSDSSEGVVTGTTTSIVSLGAVRDLTFRRKSSRTDVQTSRLDSGSLFVIASGVQDDWEHAVLRAEGKDTRVSLTFRHLTPR